MPKDYSVGMRVFLPDITGETVKVADILVEMRQPKPEVVGKYGTITAFEETEIFGTNVEVPVITLDDGEGEIRGYECWWLPVKNQNEA